VLTRWAHRVVRFRWVPVALALLILVSGATWGRGVFDELTSGGFDDPDSESVRTRSGSRPRSAVVTSTWS